MGKDTRLVNIYIKIHNKRNLTVEDLQYLSKYDPECFEKTCKNVVYNVPDAKEVLQPQLRQGQMGEPYAQRQQGPGVGEAQAGTQRQRGAGGYLPGQQGTGAGVSGQQGLEAGLRGQHGSEIVGAGVSGQQGLEAGLPGQQGIGGNPVGQQGMEADMRGQQGSEIVGAGVSGQQGMGRQEGSPHQGQAGSRDLFAPEQPDKEQIAQALSNLKQMEQEGLPVGEMDVDTVKNLLGNLYMEMLFPHNGRAKFFSMEDQEYLSVFNKKA
ncbi:MAG: hypothetical protein HFH38_03440 [Lachnospiraceae bacterium]|nr:hypothetical protein [Lachnospiraceae bacterium]